MRAQAFFPVVTCLAILTAAPLGAMADDAQPAAAPVAAQDQSASHPKPSSILQQPGSLTLGYGSWGIQDNETKLRQYATPPSGFFIQELRYVPLSSAGNLGVVSLHDLTQPDYRDYGQLALFGGKTRVDGLLMNNEFMDPTTSTVPTSSRNVQDYNLQQLVAPGFKLSARYRMDQQDQYFDPGYDPLHQRTRYDEFGADGRLAGGSLNLMYSELQYTDRTQTLLNTLDQHVQVSYLRDIGSSSVEAKFGTHNLSAAGTPIGYIQNTAVSDVTNVDSKTDASVALTLDNMSNPVTQNNYVREQRSATARLAHAWNSAWRGTCAAQLRQIQDVNDDHTYVDDPHWQTFEARLNGRIGENWHILARGSMENCAKTPQTQISGESDNSTLIWNSRQVGEVRIDASGDLIDGYLSYDQKRQTNDAQMTAVTYEDWNVGGDFQATHTVSLNADITYQKAEATDNQAGSPGLSDFAPGSETFDFGVNWAISPTWYMNTNYSCFLTSNNNPLLLQDANTSGHYLTIQLQNRLPHGREFSLTVSPWVYKDSVVEQMDSTPTLVMVSATTPF